MTQATQSTQSRQPATPSASGPRKLSDKPRWETPRMEDVSKEVIAQPYIRFT
ncbi:MAG TPA: hypothetical protein VMT66_06235 [Steroidobacteraceae bacterium]|nr:hypothetical protein [Steroidobacteraceae bacterium]